MPLVIPILLCLTLASVCTTYASQAFSADAFVHSVGVNTHLGYRDTIYRNYTNIIKPRLLELGVRHIRDGTFSDNVAAKYLDLGQHGIRVLLITDSRRAVTQAKRISPALFALEGVNEPDTRGSNWVERTRAEQKALWEAVKNDRSVAHLPVLVSSLANIRDNPAKLGALTDYLDFGNIHPYAAGQAPSRHWGWGTTMQQAIEAARKVSETKPIIVTECGYHNRVEEKGHPGCSEAAAAKYLPRLLMVYFKAGMVRSYTYEFADEKPDPEFADKEQHFGLIRNDGSPKPAFHAIRRTLALLKDPGPPFTAGTLSFDLQTSATNIHQLLLQKRDGTFYLALWQEADNFDTKAKKDVRVPEQPAKLALNQACSAMLHRPSSTDGPIERRPASKVHDLSIPDEVLIVELKKEEQQTR